MSKVELVKVYGQKHYIAARDFSKFTDENYPSMLYYDPYTFKPYLKALYKLTPYFCNDNPNWVLVINRPAISTWGRANYYIRNKDIKKILNIDEKGNHKNNDLGKD